MQIEFWSDAFPPGTVANGISNLTITWDDLLWAAMTVGRPNRHYVFKHGMPSLYEALFRLSMVRMALEQAGPTSHRFRRTEAAKTLDPSEKSAVSYFLGLTICKVFASRLLNTPWLLHLDVFRPKLDPVLKGRSRPDLVGLEAGTTKWHAFECKGRLTRPNDDAKSKAKTQAQRLISVDGVPCTLHIGAITYFRADTLQFYWCDPPAQSRDELRIETPPDVWREYYRPIADAIERRSGFQDGRGRFVIAGADLEVDVHPSVERPLMERRWEAAHRAAVETRDDLSSDYQTDGLVVKAGPSWRSRFEEGAE